MKSHKYIVTLLLAYLLFAGTVDVIAQTSGKSQVAAITNEGKTIEFSAYVSGQVLHLDFNDAITLNYVVELYNLTGAKIGEWKIEKNSDKYCEVIIDKPLRKGLYIIKVSTGQQAVAKKVQT